MANGRSDPIEAFEIFPWSTDFETGIDVIDQQHHTLVGLLNTVARNLVRYDEPFSINAVLRELVTYTEYHFDAEESLMREFVSQDEIEQSHQEAHRGFVQEIKQFGGRPGDQPMREAAEELVAFLTRWLAFHILDSDRRMCKIILAIQAGRSLEEAKKQVEREMSGAVQVLISAVLSMYEKLSSHTFLLMKEVAERQRAEAGLRRAAVVFENTLEAIFVTDDGMRILDVNGSFCRIYGRMRDQLIGTDLSKVMQSPANIPLTTDLWDTVRTEGFWSGEYWTRMPDGQSRPVWLTVSALRGDDDESLNFVGTFTDISQILEKQRALERLAHQDMLTGLPNRLYLAERLPEAISEAKRNNTLLAVCYLDLDGFKQVNDHYGHAVGDALLQEIASRMQSALRGGDTVARVGGDEFAILIGDLRQLDQCDALLTRILADAQQSVNLPLGPVKITMSIGVTLFPFDEVAPNDLLQHADIAMYQAKLQGKSQFCLYTAPHNPASVK